MEQVQGWNLCCTDITEDDEGCARFQVNSMIPADDDDATTRAAALLDSAPDLLAAAKEAQDDLATLHFAHCGCHDEECPTLGVIEVLRAAISAAEGGEG